PRNCFFRELSSSEVLACVKQTEANFGEKMNTFRNEGFVLSFLAMVILVYSAYPETFHSEFLKKINCIAESGFQPYCDLFILCNNLLSKPYLDAYDRCVEEICPNGIGKCSEDEELYNSRENRTAIHYCIMDEVEKEGSDKEEIGLNQFLDCLDILSSICLGDVENENK
ncbi:hypothetical protein NPIL_585941, partial [Nephila pilipes]